MTVNFDYIKELDKDGNAVGSTGKKKHSINTFARENFTFPTSGLKSHYQNLSVKHTQFEATISGPGAKLIVDIYVFKEAGNVSTSENETLEVKQGTIKFNIKLENWTFCGAGDNCKKGQKAENGSQVEFGIEIKGRGKPTKKPKAKGKGRKVETLDLGGADCTLSGAVSIYNCVVIWGVEIEDDTILTLSIYYKQTISICYSTLYQNYCYCCFFLKNDYEAPVTCLVM